MKRLTTRGFTLVEIILVIIIIGILAAIIVPKFAGQQDNAKIATTKANLNSLRSAVRLFQSDNNGDLPGTLGALVPTYIRVLPEEAISDPPSTDVVAAVDGGGGWAYDATTGEVAVNLSGNDPNGDAYAAY
ncbi:MAG: prepilin-type N-terminal cleavage/methylation domain-containing protein [Verrucomicrobia bacterium]|nr:prepilin-type N-terminal cleavage/methylation domain-containing protein [Verrucomicrobiota bacterium]